MLGILIQQVALGGPRTSYLAYISPTISVVSWEKEKRFRNSTFGFIERPKPTGIDMAMARGVNKGISVVVVHLSRVDFAANILCCKFPAFNDGFLRPWNKGIHNFVGNLSS